MKIKKEPETRETEKIENTIETEKIKETKEIEETENINETESIEEAESTKASKPGIWKLLGKGFILAAVVLLLMSCLPEDPDDHDDSRSVYAAREDKDLTKKAEDTDSQEPGAEQESDSEQESESGQKSESGQGTDSERKSKSEKEAGAEQKSKSGKDTGAEQKSESGQEAEPEQKLKSEREAEPVSGQETGPEQGAESEPETASGQKKRSGEEIGKDRAAGTGQETAALNGTEQTAGETEEETLTAASKKALILKNEDQYPEDILKLLEINSMEAIDFVLDYPEKKGQVYADDIEDDYEEGKIPLLIQWDERWGYGSYGNNVVAVSGCGPTCMAMVIAGLTGNTDVTPYTMAKYSDENGYVTQEGNTMWTFIREGGLDYGVAGTDIALDEEIVKEALQAGKPVICSMRPGDFTTSGHFIVLTGYEDGMISVNDPASRIRSSQLWTFERLAPQIKNLWMCEYVGGENTDDVTYEDDYEYSEYEEYNEYEEYAGDEEYYDY